MEEEEEIKKKPNEKYNYSTWNGVEIDESRAIINKHKKIVVQNQKNDEENSVEYNESYVLGIFKKNYFIWLDLQLQYFIFEYKYRHS